MASNDAPWDLSNHRRKHEKHLTWATQATRSTSCGSSTTDRSDRSEDTCSDVDAQDVVMSSPERNVQALPNLLSSRPSSPSPNRDNGKSSGSRAPAADLATSQTTLAQIRQLEKSRVQTPATQSLGSFSPFTAFQNMLLGGCYSIHSDDSITVSCHTTGSHVHDLGPGFWGEEQVQYKFECLKHDGILGYGAFGSVTLVKCGVTGQSLALKSMSKGMLDLQRMQKNVKTEKLVMQRACSPFVVKLAACFNQDQHVCFLMEAATGGDLFSVFRQKSFWGLGAHSRFYLACVASGLHHLHGLNVIYRDLKVENVVIDEHGYAKLCDFGLSKFLDSCQNGRTYTMCGTPEYMAPETVSSKGYTVAADWWSLGILLCWMQMAATPFAADSPREILANAKAGIDSVKFPDGASWPELVKDLCARNPSERLPMRTGGIQNLRHARFFTEYNFDWEAHANCRMDPPYVPAAMCKFDLSEMSKPRDVYYKGTTADWDADFNDTVGPADVYICHNMVAEGQVYL